MPSIFHLSSAHPRNDVRIFVKQCQSLAQEKYNVSLCIADGKGDSVDSKIKIIDVGKPTNRFARFFISTLKVFNVAKKADADLYHLHDPELIPIGLILKILGKKVVFDAHEDFPNQLKSKEYIPNLLRPLLVLFFKIFEKYALKHFDLIVCATPKIRDKFDEMKIRSIDINNYPFKQELSSSKDFLKKNQIIYAGVIAGIRGIKEVVKALELLDGKARLVLLGKFESENLYKYISSLPGWNYVDYLGQVNRDCLAEHMGQSVAGIVTFLPYENHINSQPNKMFEYMSASLPIIGSNFELWKYIIQGNDCGICVDPLDEQQIATAIEEIICNKENSKKMGINGKNAVLNMYNWEAEKEKLFDAYLQVLK